MYMRCLGSLSVENVNADTSMLIFVLPHGKLGGLKEEEESGYHRLLLCSNNDG